MRKRENNMNKKKTRLIIIFSSGFFLLLDQFLKWQAMRAWADSRLIWPRFGWQVFLNKGAAFGISLNNALIIALSIPIVLLIGYIFLKELTKENFSRILLLAWSLILAGGISNLLDRIIYRQVIDYFLINMAIINISDIMIAGGLVICLLNISCHSDDKGGISVR